MLVSNRYTEILEITPTSILPTKGLFLIGTICSRAEPQYESQTETTTRIADGIRLAERDEEEADSTPITLESETAKAPARRQRYYLAPAAQARR